MTRKAFTVIELTTVLLVIGLLIVIAVKSAAIMDGARTRAAVGNVQKLQGSFNSMLSLYQQSEYEHFLARSVDTPGAFDKEQFVTNGVLRYEDFEVYKSEGSAWDFVTCDEGDNGTDNFHDIYTDYKGMSVCLVADTNFGGQAGAEFACNIEAMLDDGWYDRADVRVNAIPATPPKPCIEATGGPFNVHILVQ
jgi:type II secretory pathway pseudopilin PulG